MAKKELKRSDVKDEYKWDIECLYETKEDFYRDLDKLKKLINDIERYKGNITKDENSLYEFLKYENKVDSIIENLYTYAFCKSDEDVSNSDNQKLQSEVLALYSLYGDLSSFVFPELMKTDYETIKKYIYKNPKLKEYEFDLYQIYRYQKYTLSDNEEKLLSNINDLQTRYEKNFSIALNSLADFGYIKDEDNNEVKLSLNNYSKYIKSKNREVRKQAFENKGKTLKKYVNLLAVDYEGLVKSDAMIAKARGYKTSLQMHLYEDGVDEKLYDTLLNVSKNNLHVLHKYYKLIKDVLKLDSLKAYDLSAPLVDNYDKKYSIDDAKNIILNALSPLSDEYVSILKKAFKEKWIDFIPNENKRTGYYEIEAKKGHPLILANYNEDFSSVSALAHELGHAIHSYYSSKNQPSHLSQYPIFVAEVISLTNEMILSNYIVKTSKDKKEKLNAIANILDVFASNFYGTLSDGSIFEKIVHKKICDGQALTEIDFNEIFEKIVYEHNGDIVDKNDYLKYNWCRVPHFYTPFYYYKYAIGVCGACFVCKRIINNDKEYLKKYFEFLKLGGSKMPMDLLKTLDLDLTNTSVIEEGIKYFDELIDEFLSIYNS